MDKITKKDFELLDVLIKNELLFIENGFIVSDFVGKLFLQNSLTDFKENYLKNKYGEIIYSMSSEYRYFIIGILEGLASNNRSSSIRDLITNSNLNSVSTMDLLSLLKNKIYH